MRGHHMSQTGHQPVWLPILLGQLKRDNEISLSPFTPEKLVSRNRFGPSRSASFRSFSIPRLNQMAYSQVLLLPPAFRDGVHSYRQPPSGRSRVAYRWRARVTGAAYHMDQILRAPLFPCSTHCVCVCVFFLIILDIKFVGRTRRGHTGGRSHRISHPPSFCDACLSFYREKDQPFLSLVNLEVEFCVLTI